MGITGSVSGITGSIIEGESSGNLVVFILIILVFVGVGFYLVKEMKKKRK